MMEPTSLPLPQTTEEMMISQQQEHDGVNSGSSSSSNKQRRRIMAGILMFCLPFVTITQTSLLGHDPNLNDSIIIRQTSSLKKNTTTKQQSSSSSSSSSSPSSQPVLLRGFWKTNNNATKSLKSSGDGKFVLKEEEHGDQHIITRSVWTNTTTSHHTTKVTWTNTTTVSGSVPLLKKTTTNTKKQKEAPDGDDDDYYVSNDSIRRKGDGDDKNGEEHLLQDQQHAAELAALGDPYRNRRITMVVELSGELGNNLFHLFHGYAMKMRIEEVLPNVTIELVGEHQDASKWTRPAADIKKCFPNLRNFDFSSGRWDGDGEFAQRQKSQNTWLRQMNYTDKVVDVDNNLANSIQFVQQMLRQQQEEPNNFPIQEPTNAKISLPYLRVHKMQIDVENYRTQVQQWLAFDKQACCGILPDPDEVVFHFRNFASEGAQGYLPNQRGFVEVGPKHIVPLLQDNMPSNTTSKVTLITRHYADKPNAADPHITAIAKSGKFHLRVIPEQSGVQDFCLLLHAKHVVATRLSSYAAAAGVLGNQTSVTTYAVNSTEVRKHKPYLFHDHGWKGDSIDPTFFNRFKHINVPGEYKF